MSLRFLTLALAASTTVWASELDSPSLTERDDPCLPCNPQGSSPNPPPPVGTGLSSLYIDVLNSVQGIHFKKREQSLPVRANGFCCRQSLNCVNVQSLNIPMCYDKFQVQFAFIDGSYGSLVTGQYTASGGATANLLTGNYTNGNDQGNIYASDPQDKPNTATLSIPPQFTGTGVGAPIPASALGSYLVFTTTIPGATYTAATTIPQSVRVATISGGQVVSVTVAAQTITGPTTIAPQTTTVTQAGVATGAASSSSHHGAGNASVDFTRSTIMTILCNLMYFLFAV